MIRGFGEPWQASPAQSAFVLAGLTSWLYYDDTAYAGHLSNSTATVPMAYAHALGLDGRGLLTAVIAANECAARITAAATLGRFRGQNAPHTHLAGAVSGRLAPRAPRPRTGSTRSASHSRCRPGRRCARSWAPTRGFSAPRCRCGWGSTRVTPRAPPGGSAGHPGTPRRVPGHVRVRAAAGGR